MASIGLQGMSKTGNTMYVPSVNRFGRPWRWKALLAACAALAAVCPVAAQPPQLGDCDDVAHNWFASSSFLTDAAGRANGVLSPSANIRWVRASLENKSACIPASLCATTRVVELACRALGRPRRNELLVLREPERPKQLYHLPLRSLHTTHLDCLLRLPLARPARPQDSSSGGAVNAASSPSGDSFVDLGSATLGGVLSAAAPGAAAAPVGLSLVFALQVGALPAQSGAAPAKLAYFAQASGNSAVALELLPTGQLHWFWSDASGQVVRRNHPGGLFPKISPLTADRRAPHFAHTHHPP